jgi:hypothetical protein
MGGGLVSQQVEKREKMQQIRSLIDGNAGLVAVVGLWMERRFHEWQK